jgi:hypothetical protein
LQIDRSIEKSFFNNPPTPWEFYSFPKI